NAVGDLPDLALVVAARIVFIGPQRSDRPMLDLVGRNHRSFTLTSEGAYSSPRLGDSTGALAALASAAIRQVMSGLTRFTFVGHGSTFLRCVLTKGLPSGSARAFRCRQKWERECGLEKARF